MVAKELEHWWKTEVAGEVDLVFQLQYVLCYERMVEDGEGEEIENLLW